MENKVLDNKRYPRIVQANEQQARTVAKSTQ
jgi:hypothetical protein